MGLMTTHGLVVLGPVQRLVSHKEFTIEMVNLIIRETDLDECGNHATEDLGASSLFNLARVSIR